MSVCVNRVCIVFFTVPLETTANPFLLLLLSSIPAGVGCVCMLLAMDHWVGDMDFDSNHSVLLHCFTIMTTN